MPTRGEFSKRWVPRGTCDTLLGDNAKPGAMTSLQNLIHDPTTAGVFICRPANTELIDFSTLPGSPGTAGVVTVAWQVGDYILGLIGITSGTYSGLDLPFCYNTVTAAFVAVSGLSTAKVPTSQATSGAWTPPDMTLTGVDLVVTHPGFDGVTYFLGWFDVTTPTSPVWHAGNTGGHGLPSVPTACGTYNNRTYLACGNAVYYTDTLAINMTNSNQSFTLGDAQTSVLALQPLAVSNQTNAVAEALLAFKAKQIYQITGDVSTSNLASPLISPSVGTAAARSVVPTPYGVYFMAVDGIRCVTFLGQVQEPDDDLANPFINALVPSRVCAAFNSDTYRICTQNGAKTNTPYEDYWYNFRRKSWSGPHTFRYDTIVPFSNDFALASNGITGKMWNSFTVQGHADQGNTFTENGSGLNWDYKTPPMLDLDNMYANAVQRSTLEIAIPAEGQTYDFYLEDDNGTQVASATITEGTTEMIWGTSTWGSPTTWGASTTGLTPLQIPWTEAGMANRFIFEATGESSLGLKLGAVRVGYERLNYFYN